MIASWRPGIGRRFLHDVSVCPRCQGPATWLEVATEPDAVDRALADHSLTPDRAVADHSLTPHRPPPPPIADPAHEAQLTLPL